MTFSSLSASIEKFEQKTLRERLLLLAAIAVVLFFCVDSFLLTPQKKQLKQLAAQIETDQAALQQLSQQIAQAKGQLARRNAPDHQAELDTLLHNIETVDALLSEDDGSALQLAALLRAMLHTAPGISLLSLKTLPVTALLGQPSAANKNKTAADTMPPPIVVHRHGVEIIIKGNYLALLPYLARLHDYPKRLFWSELRLEVEKHPNAILRLSLYTLSEQKAAPIQ